MLSVTDFSKKLDGKVAIEKAGATGHVCTWECLPKHTPDCDQYQEEQYEVLLAEQIDRSKRAIQFLDFNDRMERHDHMFHWTFLRDLKLLPKPKKTTRYELGAREFTLTYSPKWMNDAQARVEMEKAIDKLCRYYDNEIVELRAVGEVGSNGLSHIHCFYKLEGGLKITDKNFKRAWKYWNPSKPLGRGFEGGHHATVREESDFLGYIEKEIETSWYETKKSSQRET